MTTSNWKPVKDSSCPKCGAPMEYSIWESSDGAFEDTHYRCTNERCLFNYWVDGPDA